MKTFRTLLTMGLIMLATNTFAQNLPESYQPMLTDIVENFKSISSGNSINDGETSLRVINEKLVVLRVEHQNKVKNLSFEIKPDEENQPTWFAANDLTIDMVNKYESYLTKTLQSMHKLSEKKSKE